MMSQVGSARIPAGYFSDNLKKCLMCDNHVPETGIEYQEVLDIERYNANVPYRLRTSHYCTPDCFRKYMERKGGVFLKNYRTEVVT